MSFASQTAEKAQKIRNRLGLFRGEWFRDLRIGTPWYERILGVKNPNIFVLRNVIRAAILSVPGIVDVQDNDLRFEGRTFIYTWNAVDDSGELIPGGIGEPYILEIDQ